MALEDALDLVDWRRRVGDLYRLQGPGALEEFRRGRDRLFATHSQSPIEDRAAFKGVDYFEPDPSLRFTCSVGPPRSEGEIVIDTGGEDGAIGYRRAGTVEFSIGGAFCALTIFEILAYGHGLFLPFKDATSGRETYGGGRYLFDTIKNTDGLALEVTAGSREVVIDFNYAYNPSCAYNPRWACPLAPPENTLTVAIRAGEKSYH